MAFESGTTDLGANFGEAGVTSLNGLTGALTLVAGSGITITPSGSNIVIASTGGSSLNIGTFDSEPPVSDALQIIANELYAQSATPSFPGMVNIGTQSFAGPKTFEDVFTLDASQISHSITVSSDYVIDPNADYEIYVIGVTGPVQITLPAGVDGQEFYVQDALGTAGSSTISFITTGSDIIAQQNFNITSAFGSRRWIFRTVIFMSLTFGVWYFEEDFPTTAISGDSNTVAFFNNSGTLSDDISFTYNSTNRSLTFGDNTAGGSITSGSSCFAFGSAEGSIISASAQGNLCFGLALNTASIVSAGSGSFAFGSVTDTNSIIQTEEDGSFSFGSAASGGEINSAGQGSFAGGFTSNSAVINANGNACFSFGICDGSANLTSNSNGCFVIGSAADSATIQAMSGACFAGGVAENTSSAITSSANASFAYGRVLNAGQINASADGSFALGYCTDNGSEINALQIGSMAFGFAEGGGEIAADGVASLAFGHVTNGSAIGTDNDGSLAFGYITGTGLSLIANGHGALAFGVPATGPVQAAEDGSMAAGDNVIVNSVSGIGFGLGLNNSSAFAYMFGRWANLTPNNPTTWSDTDPILVLGNGTDDSDRSNAFEVDKDGKIFDTGSHVESAIRVITTTDTISDRTDFVVVCDTTGTSGNLNLPVGAQGLTYIFTTKGNSAAVYTLIANGADTFDTAVITIIASGVISRIKFLGGIWYAV